MALTAHDTVGFEPIYNKSHTPHNVRLYDAATGTTYTKGTLVTVVNGLLANLTTTSLGAAATPFPVAGVVAETVVTTDGSKKVAVYQVDDQVFRVSFTGHADVTASANSTVLNRFHTTLASNATKAIGSLIYIYEGPGKGAMRTILTGTTGTNLFTISGEWPTLPTTASKAIITSAISTAAVVSDGMNVGRQLKIAPAGKKVHTTPPTFAEGYINVVAIDPANLKVDVAIASGKAFTSFGSGTT